MKHNYDTVAWCYDALSRLVFGRRQVQAQLFLLQYVPAGAHILIAGGGTGWILEEIARRCPAVLTITYADVSAAMITRAKQRNAGKNKVTFVNAGVEELSQTQQYDVVLTPFLFDNFTVADAARIFNSIDTKLRSGGAWLYCDFNPSHALWQRALMRTMYLFFHICCGIKAASMPAMGPLFRQGGYATEAQLHSMGGLIAAVVYRKA